MFFLFCGGLCFTRWFWFVFIEIALEGKKKCPVCYYSLKVSLIYNSYILLLLVNLSVCFAAVYNTLCKASVVQYSAFPRDPRKCSFIICVSGAKSWHSWVVLSLDEQPFIPAHCKGISHFISAMCDDSSTLLLMMEGRLRAFTFLFGLVLLSCYLGSWNYLYSVALDTWLCLQTSPKRRSRDF